MEKFSNDNNDEIDEIDKKLKEILDIENMTDEELLEKLWEDADFKTTKKPIKQHGEALKKDGIRKYKEYSNGVMVFTNCKVCGNEMKISSNYNGEFPLCFQHRDPNHRLIKY